MYEKLKKRVYEILYPEGIPLEVGCEIYYDNHIFTLISKDPVWIGDPAPSILELAAYSPESTHYVLPDEYDNLGKPLTLLDVLRAFEIKFHSSWQTSYRDKFYIVKYKKFHIDSLKEDEWIPYNLTKPMSEQSEETLSNLYKLLK